MANCAECGKEFRRRQFSAEFCGGTCRRVFNNRRQVRGAALYDLTMIVDNATSADMKAKTQDRITTLKAMWKLEDEKHGRKRTWQHSSKVFTI